MKILVTGASGYLGSAIYKNLLEKEFNVVGTYLNTRRFDELVHVDLTSCHQVTSLIEKVNPQVIIHTAADAHTSTCESNPEYAKKINVLTTQYLANEAKAKNIRFIHISTFSCYNANPTSIYQKTKLEAESILKELNDYLILRLSVVVGLSPNTKSKNFYNDLIKAHIEGAHFEADSSWQFEMSYLGNVAKLIMQLLNKPEITKRTIPYVDEGITSRYQIAKDLLGENVIEATSNRIIPLPELDLTPFKKYGLYRGNYKDCITRMKEELENL